MGSGGPVGLVGRDEAEKFFGSGLDFGMGSEFAFARIRLI
jgi:hypothetical protein